MEQEHIEDEKNAFQVTSAVQFGKFCWTQDNSCERDPLYSRDVVSQYIEKNQEFIKSKRFTVKTVNVEELGKVDISKKLKVDYRCPVFNENYWHWTLVERSRLPYKRKLCYGCFEEITKEHNAKSWANRRICKVCNGKHPTTPHAYVRKKK